ncbi:MAG: MmgE/PrpD family protein [Alphaproteobacteria bacterium]|jgi:2-methylcitrate dehydratase PrpD|nr:MmgE/PrpD family protein [Alphaproteobacteria bacterium]
MTGDVEGNAERDVTAAIADFAGSLPTAEVPDTVIERAKIHILDSLGLALAGSVSDAARIVREDIVAQGLGGEGSVIIGTALSAPPRFAAFANATAVHADNFDDTTPQVRADRTGGIHASGAVLPVVLALGQSCGASGGEILRAYLAGVEVASRLNHTIAARHYGDGFHTTGTMNVFGAAIAAAVLKGLGRAETVNAIGIAASHASGIRRNFGTMAEVLHPAQAAQAGITAVDLAARGLTAAGDALHGPVGYFAAAAGGYDAAGIVGKLGTPWVFEDPGVWIKPHPNGALTHPGAGCLLALLTEHDVASEQIAGISVKTNHRVLKTLIHHDPADGMQAKFSMEFTLAIVALDRRAGLGEFTTATLNRSDVREMMRKVDYTAYETIGEGYTNVTTLIDVALQDGRTLSGRANHARGSTKSPMGFDEVAEKYRSCAAYSGHPEGRVANIEMVVRKFDELVSVESLLNALVSKG